MADNGQHPCVGAHGTGILVDLPFSCIFLPPSGVLFPFFFNAASSCLHVHTIATMSIARAGVAVLANACTVRCPASRCETKSNRNRNRTFRPRTPFYPRKFRPCWMGFDRPARNGAIIRDCFPRKNETGRHAFPGGRVRDIRSMTPFLGDLLFSFEEIAELIEQY